LGDSSYPALRNLQGFIGIYRDNTIFLYRDIYRDIQRDIQGDNKWQCTIRYSNMVMENHKFIDYNARKTSMPEGDQFSRL
jgi:hypothetical protein